MTDAKTRKVLVVENPLLSTQVKDMIARVLFDNLQVRAYLILFPSPQPEYKFRKSRSPRSTSLQLLYYLS